MGALLVLVAENLRNDAASPAFYIKTLINKMDELPGTLLPILSHYLRNYNASTTYSDSQLLLRVQSANPIVLTDGKYSIEALDLPSTLRVSAFLRISR